MAEITVREATPEDVDDILSIAERGWNDAYSGILAQEAIDTAIREWYDADNTRETIAREDVAYFVVERDGKTIGYLSGGPSDEERVAILGAVYVDPNYWGKVLEPPYSKSLRRIAAVRTTTKSDSTYCPKMRSGHRFTKNMATK